MRKCAVSAAVFACAFLLLGGVAFATDFSPGAAGVGDPYFPLAGNGGYDVGNYDLTLAYDPAANQLTGTAVINATATQDLSRIDLDLRGFSVTRVLVGARAARFQRDGQELVITLGARKRPRGVIAGGQFMVTVEYAGTPSVVTDADGSVEGWVPTNDGAFVVGEPQGSPAWYPVNDTQLDKATYDFAVTVPDGLTVMANGVLLSHESAAGKTTWRWRESDPMASYLATATIGYFDLTQYSVDGIPAYIAVDPQLSKSQVLAALPDAIRFYSSIYGPYPFTAVGAIVDTAPGVGYALETQTKPVFASMPDEATLVHELAHQWYGDSVTMATWPDIWLSEGFATFSEWIWSEHQGSETAHQTFTRLYSTSAGSSSFWNPPPGVPGGPAFLFDGTIYYRGGMTLQALREKVGDAAFFQIMRDWAQQNRFGTVSTPEFIALAELRSGIDLDAFFQAWLYLPGKPTVW